jgi:hypothetical protein
LSNVYANTCHYGDFSGSTQVVIIGCWFYFVDSSFTEVFCDVSIESKLLMSIALYDYKMSFNLLGLGEELEHWVKP